MRVNSLGPAILVQGSDLSMSQSPATICLVDSAGSRPTNAPTLSSRGAA